MLKRQREKGKDGQVIQYLDGFAWGVTPEGETVCLGAEDEVREILSNPRRHSSNPIVAQIISLERELSKQEEKKDKIEQKKTRGELLERKKRAKHMGITVKKMRGNKKRA